MTLRPAAAIARRSLRPPFTPRQRLMWVEEQLSHGLPLNSVTTLLEIRGEVNMPAIARAFVELERRHDALRLSLPGSKGIAFRPLPPDKACRLELVDLGGASDGKAFEQWMAERLRGRWQPHAPLYDLALVRRGARDYVLFVNRHHIVSDNSSSAVLHGELEALYQQLPLDPAPSYAAYLLGEAAAAASADASEAFWAGRHAAKPPSPRFYGGPAVVSSIHYRRVSLTLDAETSRAIDRLGRLPLISLFLLTVLFAFLRRVTGERDLSVGMPLHNRTEATQRMIGLIMNVSPVRITFEDADTFNDLRLKVRKELDEVRPHRRHTVSSQQAGYQVLFNFLPDVPVSFAGNAAHYVHTAPHVLLDDLGASDLGEAVVQSREKLGVTVQGRKGTPYEVHLDVNRSILPTGMPFERAGDHFLAMLQAFLRDPGQSIDAVDILSADERARLLAPVPASPVPAVKVRTVVDMFRTRAAADPDRVAVVGPDARLTYRELDRRAQALAVALREAGVRPHSVVALYVDRTPAMVVALLAVLLAGGTYVPIDPAHPEERIAFILEDTAPSVLVSETALWDRLGTQWQGQVICLDTLAPALHGASDIEAREMGPAPEDLAYVVYTSGSTGRPKGVAITHAQLAGFVDAMGERIGISAGDRVLATTSIAFDPMIVEVFLPLVTGAAVVVAPQVVAMDGRALARALDEYAITIMQATPATFRMLLSADWNGRPGLTVLCGAEVMSTSLAESLLARVGVLWNLYGPTETTVWATAKQVTGQTGDTVPVGVPLDGTRVHVLNQARVPVPIGVPGEIYIGGPRVAHGYHARPELTQERFLADPFSLKEMDRMYRTGDFGRLREDLDLEFIGRTDNQVKVRGHRVELEEVEAVIARHEGVVACCVTTFVDGSGEAALNAHIVCAGGPAAFDSQALLAFLRRQLPKYMVPARTFVVERLPRSPTGKVDRAAVARIEMAQPAIAARGVPPKGELEEDMLEIWREVLNAPHLGVTDDFFEAGGHSLLVISLVLKIQRRLGIELGVERIFKAPTVRTLCGSMSETAVPLPAVALPISTSRAPDILYFVHGRAQFIPIAKALQDAVASVAVFPNGTKWLKRLVGDDDPLGAIRRVSDAFAQAILNAHRGEHLYVAGHSFGGSLAVETACQLEALGTRPHCVFIFDTKLRSDQGSGRAPARRRGARVATDSTEFSRAMDAFRIAGVHAYDGPSRPLSSPVVLFTASEDSSAWRRVEKDITLGWGRHFGAQMTVIPVPGDHATLIEAHAIAIAREMRPHLLRV